MWGMASGTLVPKSPTHAAPDPWGLVPIIYHSSGRSLAAARQIGHGGLKKKKAFGETYPTSI